MIVICVKFLLLALVAARRVDLNGTSNICDLLYCDCYEDLHPTLKTVQCLLDYDTNLDIFSYDLPNATTELIIYGGNTVTFEAGTFNGVTDMRRIHVNNTRSVVFRRFAAVDINVLTLYLEIERCNRLRFEKHSFQKLRGPMSVNINRCDVVTVEGDTFSWLINIEITDVYELYLGIGSFSLDPSAANVGDHGPGMSVELKHSKVSEFPRSTFGSSAARVRMEQIDIETIRTGAFSANTYNIVMAINCSVKLIEENAFSDNSLINYLSLDNSRINRLSSRAFRSAIANINIQNTRIDYVETGAINTTVANVKILNNEFHMFMERGIEISSWNFLQMQNNSFDELPANAIVSTAASSHNLIFSNNEIETMHPKSLSFIGDAANAHIEYENNYFGQNCHCNINHWLAQALNVKDAKNFETHSYCTVNRFFAVCYNAPDLNMPVRKFLTKVCNKPVEIECERLKTKSFEMGGGGEKNPRFPHKYKYELSERNKKVIGIVIVSCLGCVAVVALFSFFKWWKRHTGGWASIKAIFISFKTMCLSVCRRICACRRNEGIDNARPIIELNVNEYSERRRLNETRANDAMHESNFQNSFTVLNEDRFTQTLPEELTKELLDQLNERLDNPENYLEAREMIEHLYEIIKRADEAPPTVLDTINHEENIYNVPFQNTTRPIRSNITEMTSIGTSVPSLNKLTPLSPSYRRTLLSGHYYEPRDLAVHLYAEIANSDRPKTLTIPDVLLEQAHSTSTFFSSMISPYSSDSVPSMETESPLLTTDIPLNSISTSSSSKMMNRPLPEKPQGQFSRADQGEGPSLSLG